MLATGGPYQCRGRRPWPGRDRAGEERLPHRDFFVRACLPGGKLACAV